LIAASKGEINGGRDCIYIRLNLLSLNLAQVVKTAVFFLFPDSRQGVQGEGETQQKDGRGTECGSGSLHTLKRLSRYESARRQDLEPTWVSNQTRV